jgi:hypothetical protein
MKKVIILAVLILISQSSWAQIREFQTTRLISTSGTGVASVLSSESAILNPAGSSFFEGSSASYTRYSTSLKKENDLRNSIPDKFAKRNESQGVFISDHSDTLKGGVAYITQAENDYSRERLILHSSSMIGEKSSMGLSYRYTMDKRPSTTSPRHKNFHQATIGTMHVVDDHTILGLVITDPTRSNSGDERATGGIQYELAERVTIIADAGFQFTKAYNKAYVWSGAVQLKLFDDFFIRAGQFYDNVRKSKGTSWGVSWLGPRLGIEFAQKFSDQFAKNSYVYQNETIVDTSLSAIIKF